MWENSPLVSLWQNAFDIKESVVIPLRKMERVLELCSRSSGTCSPITVALNLPNVSTLYYCSSCCDDPLNHKSIFIATS